MTSKPSTPITNNIVNCARAVLLSRASLEVMLACAEPAELFARASFAVVLTLILDPPHRFRPLLWRLCSHMPAPRPCIPCTAFFTGVLADARTYRVRNLINLIRLMKPDACVYGRPQPHQAQEL